LRNGGGVKGKVLEALWHGVPLLTTPIGAEGIPDTSASLEIAEPGEFATKLAILYVNPGKLAGLASAGHQMLAKHFSTAAFRDVLAEDIPELRQMSQDFKSSHSP
jgi:glycosyltransferase involved in cell wall biosynthesis